MDNTVYYEAVDITATHESQERLHIWAFCNDVTLCACVRVRACVCVFGSGVHLCVSVCLVRDFDLWFRFGTLHSNPGNAAEQSHCGSGRTDNKFTIFLLVAEDFSQLYLFRDTRGKRAPLVKNGRRSIFRGQTAVLWLSWWDLRLSGLKAVTAGGHSWTSDLSSGPGGAGKWIVRVLLWNPEEDVLK